MKVNILGTDYEIVYTNEKEYNGLRNRRGCCDESSKKIYVLDDWDILQYYAYDNIAEMVKKTKRHEIVHAFLYESGNDAMSENEGYVDWVAMMYPKLKEAFEKAGAV